MALHGFAAALLEQVQDPVVKRIAERPLIGSLDLLCDNTDLTANPVWRPIRAGCTNKWGAKPDTRAGRHCVPACSCVWGSV